MRKSAGVIIIIFSSITLFAQTPSRKFWLRHYDFDVFETIDMKNGKIDTSEAAVQLMFQMDVTGTVASFSVLPDGQALIFKHGEKTKILSKEDVEIFSGTYILRNMEAKINLKQVLHLIVPGQPASELVPIDPDKFSIKTLPHFTVILDVDASGKITGFTSVQPNGSFKARKK